MSRAFVFGRLSYRCTPLLFRLSSRQTFCSRWPHKQISNGFRSKPSKPMRLLFAASLSSATFLKLSEENGDDGKTSEQHMLEASRQEIRKQAPRDVKGPRQICRTLLFFLDQYIYEPLATTARFLHLAFIFVPVIIAVPILWVGSRRTEHGNERAGTLWWYGFLVRSMERAGPAFIKVCASISTFAIAYLS